MKIGVAISLSLLGHGIVLMSWPGTPDLAVNSTPSSFQVSLEQKQTIQKQLSRHKIKKAITHKAVQLKKNELVEKVVHKEEKQETAVNKQVNNENRAFIVKRISAELENYFQYPMLARRNGWQGKVVLALLLDTDGRFENVHIKTGSGFKILDQSALEALLKVRKISKSGQWFNMRNQEIIIPVIYQLKEG